jgi:importin subunit beta-1
MKVIGSVNINLYCPLQNDYDMIEYLNELREGCLESYTGIIQGLKGDAPPAVADTAGVIHIPQELNLVQQHVPYIVQFITIVAQDSEKSDGAISAAAGLIG